VNTYIARPARHTHVTAALPGFFRVKGRYLAVMLLALAGCGSLSQQCPYSNIVTQSTSGYQPTVPAQDCQAVQDLGDGLYQVLCADGREGYLIQ